MLEMRCHNLVEQDKHLIEEKTKISMEVKCYNLIEQDKEHSIEEGKMKISMEVRYNWIE